MTYSKPRGPLQQMGVYSLPGGLYFEFLVACECQRLLGVEGKIDHAAGAAVRSGLSAAQARREEDRAEDAAEVIGRHIKANGWCVRKILWTGVERPKEGSPADLIFETSGSAQPLRYSLKSVSGSGVGTAKNWGLDYLATLLRVDYEPIVTRALKSVRETFRSRTSALSAALGDCSGWAQMKTLVHKRDPEREAPENRIAKDTYRPFQREIAKASVEAFNALPRPERARILYKFLGCEEGTFILIANREGIVIYDPSPVEDLLKKAALSAQMKPRGHSWVVVAVLPAGTREVPLVRANSAATNRLGLSDPCQRTFLLPGGLRLFTRFPPTK